MPGQPSALCGGLPTTALGGEGLPDSNPASAEPGWLQQGQPHRPGQCPRPAPPTPTRPCTTACLAPAQPPQHAALRPALWSPLPSGDWPCADHGAPWYTCPPADPEPCLSLRTTAHKRRAGQVTWQKWSNLLGGCQPPKPSGETPRSPSRLQR